MKEREGGQQVSVGLMRLCRGTRGSRSTRHLCDRDITIADSDRESTSVRRVVRHEEQYSDVMTR